MKDIVFLNYEYLEPPGIRYPVEHCLLRISRYSITCLEPLRLLYLEV
jgi:hypothetical protein